MEHLLCGIIGSLSGEGVTLRSALMGSDYGLGDHALVLGDGPVSYL